MKYWTRRRLLKAIDVIRVRQAIEEAETQTSGEIRVSLSRHFRGNLRRTAERAFARLGMHRTRERNGILFFIVPSRRRFVIFGDAGIREAGARLAEHFPYEPRADINELPDDVDIPDTKDKRAAGKKLDEQEGLEKDDKNDK